MKRTLIFAHRGANREAAENTRSAFDKALAYPIDGIETDIQLSRDGVTVLWHDDDLAKLGLPAKGIGDYDLTELRAMNFAAHFAGAGKEGVMTLQEFVMAYQVRCRLLLEIKSIPGEMRERRESKVRQTLDLIGAPDERIAVSSFDPGALIHAHHCAAAQPLILNLEPEHSSTYARRALNEQPWLHGLCVHISILNVAMVELLHGRGKTLAVYTCNSDEEIGRSLRLGVDILISDVPQKALQMRDA